MSEDPVTLRPLDSGDFVRLLEVLDEWWGGRQVRGLAQRLFFDHFADTGLAALQGDEIVGFLIGFISSSRPGEAYVHVMGVAPARRGEGLGRRLYERFFEIARAGGCGTVRAITAPVNRGSIAFHQRLGFELEPSDRHLEGVPVHGGHATDGGDRVLFVKRL